MEALRDDSGPITVVREALSVPKAVKIMDCALAMALRYNLNGAVSISNSLRWELCSQLTDDKANPGTIDIARGKIKTVLESKRSSSIQKAYMAERGYDREDYMGRMGSLFGGGVAIFADEERQRFIGAMAFSGGTQVQDQDLCTITVHNSGLYTDSTLSETFQLS